MQIPQAAMNRAKRLMVGGGIPPRKATVYWDGKALMVFQGPVYQSGPKALYRGDPFLKGKLIPTA